MAAFGADKRKVQNVLISHSHGDHYSPDTLVWLAEDHSVTVYGDGGYPQKLPSHPNLTFVPRGKKTPIRQQVVETDTVTMNSSRGDRL